MFSQKKKKKKVQNVILEPHYNSNCHNMIFAIWGNVRIQVVRHDGENVFDGGAPRGKRGIRVGDLHWGLNPHFPFFCMDI
jgi:hypothetical protein